jgi:hypothetical protein
MGCRRRHLHRLSHLRDNGKINSYLRAEQSALFFRKPNIVKNIFVLWSGGLDSTYLVYKNLLEGNTVKAGYVEIKNNIEKTIKERTSLVKLYEIFNDNFGDRFSYAEQSTFEVKASIDSVSLKQVPVWICSILYMDLNIDEVQIGYVSNDDAISFLEEIKRIYRSYEPIVERLPKLVFPLTKTKKEEIVPKLPMKYLKEVSFCEGSNSIRFCGECHPCKRMREVLSSMDASYHKLFAFGKSDEPIQYELDLGDNKCIEATKT